MTGKIQKVAVLGAGTMGHGVAQVCAMAGMDVWLRDLNDEVLTRGVSGIEKSLAKLAEKGKISETDRDAARGRVQTTTDLKQAVAEADLVVEAIPEKMALKLETFAALGEHAPKHAILGTNTSSLSVTEIAGTRAAWWACTSSTRCRS